MAEWIKETPGLGLYRCKGPNIDVDELVVAIIYSGEGMMRGLEPRILAPDRYADKGNTPQAMNVRTLNHGIFGDAEWAPYEEPLT
jgi:hypothetical protein